MTVDINSPFKNLPENETLMQLISNFAPSILNESAIRALIDTATSTANTVPALTADSGFLTFLQTFLTAHSSTLTPSDLVTRLLNSQDFLSFLLTYINANGFTNLAGLISGLEADSGFSTFLASFLVNNPIPTQSQIDLAALSTALLGNSGFTTSINAAIAAYLVAHPPAVDTTSVDLSGDIQGVAGDTLINMLQGRPFNIPKVAKPVDEIFRNSTGALDGAKWISSTTNAGSYAVAKSKNIGLQLLGDNTTAHVGGLQSANAQRYLILSNTTFDQTNKRIELWFNNRVISGAPVFGFGTVDAGFGLGSGAFFASNSVCFYLDFSDLANVVTNNQGNFGSHAHNRGNDFTLLRIDQIGSNFKFYVGGEHGGWDLVATIAVGGTTLTNRKLFMEFDIPANAVNSMNIVYVSSNIITGEVLTDGQQLTYRAGQLAFE